MPMFSNTQPRQSDSDNILLAKIAQALTGDTASSASLIGTLLGGQRGTADHTSANVVIAAASTLLLAARSTRRYAIIKNIETTTVAYIGKSGVTTSTGMELRPGQSVVWESTAAIYAVAASGNINIRVTEFHD